jgi:hypothetical protein
VRLLKIAAAPCERGEHSGGHFGFEHRIGNPSTWPDVDEIDGGTRVVVEGWAVDAAEPVEAVGVAGPHERPVGHVGEAGNAAGQSIIGTGLTKADEFPRQGAFDGRLKVDGVATGPHRSAVDIGHPRYSALEMETFKRYLMFQAMMFVFGIVGPIFLIMFFASQPDPALRWAYWAGLFITAGDVLIALWLTATTGEKPAKKGHGAKTQRAQSGRSDTSEHLSASSSSDPFLGAAAVFVSSDSGSSSDSSWFSGDSGSSWSDSGSSPSDSGSSSSDSGSSSSD